jgi:hypothetical protein
MAYHITLVTNNSSSSIAITNPAYEADSRLVGPNTPYPPTRPIVINAIKGNPNYAGAMDSANNIYTVTDNYCFWDNTNSAINGVGEATGAVTPLNAKAGNIQITVNANGTLTFATADTAASAR